MENFEEKTEIVAENVQGEVIENSEQSEQEVSEQKQESEVVDIPAEVVDEQKQVEEKQEEQTEEPRDEAQEKKECAEVQEKAEVAENSQEENNEEEKAEPPTEETKEADFVDEKAEFEKVKAELEELKATQKEEREVTAFLDFKSGQEKALAKFNSFLGENVEKAFKNSGIDVTKSIDEIRKDDPEKAKKAEAIVREAIKAQENFVNAQNAQAKEKLQAIVFNKAGRMFDKYNLSTEESAVVAETFLDILETVGLTDLGNDLKRKVELAVGRAKLLVPKAEKAVEEVKDAVEAVKEVASDAVDAIKEVITGEKEVKEEPPVEEEKIDVSAFTEGIIKGTSNVGESVTVDNVLDKLAQCPFKERTEFYQKYFDLINEAGVQAFNKKMSEGK